MYKMVYKKVQRNIVLFCLLLFFSASAGFAQMRIIRGKVVDESGKPIQDVQIEIQRTDIKGTYKTKTDKKGEYFHGGLPMGVFNVIARKEGYRPDAIQGVRPRAGEELEANFKLQPGSGKLVLGASKEEQEKLKKEAEAAEQQKKMIGEVKTLFDAGLELSRKEQYPEAIEQFKKALEKDPNQAFVWANLGDTYAKNKQLNEAIDAFRKAIELKPDEAAFHQNLGLLYARAQKPKEAEEEFKKAEAINPTTAAQNYFNLGAVLANSGKTEEAVKAFENAVRVDPNYAEAYFQLGTAQLGANKIDDAIKNMKKYLEIGKNPQNLQTAKEVLAYLEKKK